MPIKLPLGVGYGFGRRRALKRVNTGALLHRFVVVSDIHYGRNDETFLVDGKYKYQDRMNLVVSMINDELPDFVIINGDIVHDVSPDYPGGSVEMLEAVVDEYLAGVAAPYYVTAGNHDLVENAEWLRILGHERNTSFEFGEFGFVLLDSSDLTGARRICIGEEWLEQTLDDFSGKRAVFFASHIPRFSGGFGTGELDAPDCEVVTSLLNASGNVVIAFHGHFHGEDGLAMYGDIPAFFDGHVAHFGLRYWGYRTVEVYERAIVTRQHNLITRRVLSKHVVMLP